MTKTAAAPTPTYKTPACPFSIKEERARVHAATLSRKRQLTAVITQITKTQHLSHARAYTIAKVLRKRAGLKAIHEEDDSATTSLYRTKCSEAWLMVDQLAPVQLREWRLLD